MDPEGPDISVGALTNLQFCGTHTSHKRRPALHAAMECHQSTESLAAVFLTAKAQMSALQSRAVTLSAFSQNTDTPTSLNRSHVATILTSLQQLHMVVRSVLIKLAYSSRQQHQSNSNEGAHNTNCSMCCTWHGTQAVLNKQQMQPAASSFGKALAKWRSTLPKFVQQILNAQSASLQAFTATRQQHLQEEASANQVAAESLALGPDTCRALQTIVSQLRSIESCVLFQAQLLQQAAEVSDETEYSSSNFAYSSTPFSSWLKVHIEPAITAAISAAVAPEPATSSSSGRRCYMVWGSSTGWLALYAGLAYSSCQVVGIELLPLLVDVAQHVAHSAGLKNVSFQCGDLLASDLSSVSVLVLTEQCWDQELIDKAAAKIKVELPIGSVVIDYTGSMGRAGLSSSYSTAVEVPVGWNEHQQLHAYVKA